VWEDFSPHTILVFRGERVTFFRLEPTCGEVTMCEKARTIKKRSSDSLDYILGNCHQRGRESYLNGFISDGQLIVKGRREYQELSRHLSMEKKTQEKEGERR